MLHLRSFLPICAALLVGALASSPAAQVRSRRFSPGSQVPLITPVVLDFESEDDLVTPLANGQSISSPEEFGALVSITAAGANLGAAIFDSTPGGPNDPSQDTDLLVGSGNLLILQNSAAPAQTVPGVFDRPNDDQDGGQLIFDFNFPVGLLSVVLVDIDLGSSQASSLTLSDEQGRTRAYSVPPRWTTDLIHDGPPGLGTLDLTTLDPQPGHLSTATASEQAGFDASRVRRLVVVLGSSGALDDLRWSPGRSIGMVTDQALRRAIVFDADLDLVLGSVFLPILVYDCVVDPSRRLGYVADFNQHVWLIDIAASPPALATGINPILVSNPSEDLVLSPDRRFLAVSDGSSVAPLSIVDLDTRLEVGTVSTGSDCNSLDFVDDHALIGTSFNLDRIIGFSLASDGTPSLTGAMLPFSRAFNVSRAPGGRAGVAVAGGPGRMHSFLVDGLVASTTRALPNTGLTARFSNDGRRLFVCTETTVEAWSFDPLTAAIGNTHLYSIPIDVIAPLFGVERIALHPDSSRLYLPAVNGIRMHDPENGVFLGTIPIGRPQLRGIDIARGF